MNATVTTREPVVVIEMTMTEAQYLMGSLRPLEPGRPILIDPRLMGFNLHGLIELRTALQRAGL